MAIANAELSDNEDEVDDKIVNTKVKSCSKRILHKNIAWECKAVKKYKTYDCYSSVIIGERHFCVSQLFYYKFRFFSDGIKVSVGDFITLKSETPNEPLWVAKVVHMYDNLPQKFMFHGLLFCRGSDTILSGTADPRELFLVDNCDDLPLGSIIRKAKVRPLT